MKRILLTALLIFLPITASAIEVINPDGLVIQETGSGEYLTPQGAVVDETVAPAAAGGQKTIMGGGLMDGEVLP